MIARWIPAIAALLCACSVRVPDGKLRCGPGLGCPDGWSCADRGNGLRCYSGNASSDPGGAGGDSSSAGGDPDGGTRGRVDGGAGQGGTQSAASGRGSTGGEGGDDGSSGSSGSSGDGGASGAGRGGGGASGEGAGGEGGEGGARAGGSGGGAGGSGGATIDICGTDIELDDYVMPGNEFIVDLATIALNPEDNPTGALAARSAFNGYSAGLPWVVRESGCVNEACYGRDTYQNQVFDDAGVAFAALLGLSYSVGTNGTGSSGFAVLSNENVVAIRNDLNADLGATRLLFVPTVMPNDRVASQLMLMDHWAEQAAAFQMYTHWAPSSPGGFALTDAAAEDVIEKGIAIGVPIFMVPKGMPRTGYDPARTDPSDIGPAAADHPQAKFLVMQAGFEFGFVAGQNSRPDGTDHGWGTAAGNWPEGPYDAQDTQVQADYPLNRGVNALITSLRAAGIGPNENVYAVLSGVWAELITRPTEAAHVLGKLMLYVGEDNVLWGTDSLIYGGPLPQIEAFRDFEIPSALQSEYGYAALTAERKAKILGLNAARLFCLVPD